jgi:hypothetical protein
MLLYVCPNGTQIFELLMPDKYSNAILVSIYDNLLVGIKTSFGAHAIPLNIF